MNRLQDGVRLNSTKLYYPPLPEDYTPRRKLQERLELIARRPLTLVSAPAGYGKTTALCAWAKQSELNVAWLSLDETDNEFTLFLTYFLAAVRHQLPSFGAELEAIAEHGNPLSVRMFVDYFYSDLDALDRGLALVIEDFHFIHDANIHQLIGEFMRHPHPAFHLVLLSRHDPPLPLSEWRARNRIVEIRSVDLRFNLEETAAFLHASTGRMPDDAVVANLHASTEGWPAGLRLVTLSVADAGEIPDQALVLNPHNRHIVEYLAEQVINDLPADQQAFLLQTSILDRLCGPLCEAVVDTGGAPVDGRSLLRELNRENLFIIPLDGEGHWFRYHHLLREFLGGRLARNCTPAEIAGLHLRAGRWLAADGYVEEAIRHMMAAGATDEAVELVAANRHDLLNRERWPRLHIWLSLFPESVVARSPDLLLIKALFAHALRFDAEELRRLTGEIDALLNRLDLEPARARLLRAENDILRSVPHYYDLDAAVTLDYCRRGLLVLPAAYYVMRAYGWIYTAGALRHLGDVTAGYESLRQAQREDLTFTDFPRARNTVGTAFLHWLDADLLPLKELGQYVLRLASTGDQRNSMSWGHYFLACAHYHHNNLAEAAYHAQQVFDARFVSVGISNIYGGFILALIHQASGRRDKVAETMQLISAYVAEIRSPSFMGLAQAFQAELDILDGQLARAGRVAEQLLLRERPVVGPFFYEPRLTAPKALLALDDPTDVGRLAECLRRLHEQAESLRNVRVLIEVLALEAMFYERRGDEQAAFAALERSLALAEPSGFIRLYVDLGSRLRKLLERLRSRHPRNDYIKRILAAFPGEKPATSETMVEPLTERELQVLNLLAKRYSNKEIAQELFIAPVTVKRHTVNIYQKLNVGSRREAVQAAQLLHIID